MSSLFRPQAAMGFLCGLAAAALCGACVQPMPAQAFSVTTAAGASAGAICAVMAAGFSIPDPEAVHIGLGDNRAQWAAEMVRQCPDALRSAASGSLQL